MRIVTLPELDGSNQQVDTMDDLTARQQPSRCDRVHVHRIAV